MNTITPELLASLSTQQLNSIVNALIVSDIKERSSPAERQALHDEITYARAMKMSADKLARMKVAVEEEVRIISCEPDLNPEQTAWYIEQVKRRLNEAQARHLIIFGQS